ncbi:MAG TPA: hypothetical protein DEF05_11435, partial [Erwinia sp.]|uniref:hypothetical protein n=1 Tax=Erwinia citreus TaxID=558 RepID=UPI000E8213F9
YGCKGVLRPGILHMAARREAGAAFTGENTCLLGHRPPVPPEPAVMPTPTLPPLLLLVVRMLLSSADSSFTQQHIFTGLALAALHGDIAAQPRRHCPCRKDDIPAQPPARAVCCFSMRSLSCWRFCSRWSVFAASLSGKKGAAAKR